LARLLANPHGRKKKKKKKEKKKKMQPKKTQKEDSGAFFMSSHHDITLFSYWRSSSSWRVRLALHFKQLSFRTSTVNLLKNEQLTPEYFSSQRRKLTAFFGRNAVSSPPADRLAPLVPDKNKLVCDC
jgi:hypothetical protein